MLYFLWVSGYRLSFDFQWQFKVNCLPNFETLILAIEFIFVCFFVYDFDASHWLMQVAVWSSSELNWSSAITCTEEGKLCSNRKISLALNCKSDLHFFFSLLEATAVIRCRHTSSSILRNWKQYYFMGWLCNIKILKFWFFFRRLCDFTTSESRRRIFVWRWVSKWITRG